MPTWVFNALTIVALLALAWVSRRAFFLRTYVRLVAVLIVVLIISANIIPALAIPGISASLVAASMSLAVLLFAIFRSLAIRPARLQWLAEAAAEPLVLSAPFEGRWKALVGGPDIGTNHHLVASDQRFAYDFIRNDAKSLGSTIFAPVSGRVVSASDGQPDHRMSLRVIEDPMPLGNHVAIDSGRGIVFLCHLQENSVRVNTGDSVEIGTPIGRCGNSGRTTRPHLHIHAQDIPEFAFNRARGIPIAFLNQLGVPRVPRAGSTVKVSLVQNVTMSSTSH